MHPHLIDEEAEAQSQEADPRSHRELSKELPQSSSSPPQPCQFCRAQLRAPHGVTASCCFHLVGRDLISGLKKGPGLLH